MSISALGCQPKKEFSIDPQLAPYYEAFVVSGQLRGKNVGTDNLIMEFGNAQKSDPKALAYCGRTIKTHDISVPLISDQTYPTPKIVVDKSAFDRMQEFERRALLFHELGHCILNRSHTTELNEYDYAKSIMYPYLLTQIIGVMYYQALEKNYIDELFDPNAKFKNPDIALSDFYEEKRRNQANSKTENNYKTDEYTTVVIQSMSEDGSCQN